MFSIVKFMLLLLLSVNVFAAPSDCDSVPPYYGYKFNQTEIEALLKQWMSLHQEWRKEIEQEVKDIDSHKEQIELIHRSDYAKDPRKINLCGADLTGLNLSDKDLSWADFSYLKAKKIGLSNTVLILAKLDRANFTEADLWAANLTQASLKYTKLYKADLEAANLQFAQLYKTNLSHA